MAAWHQKMALIYDEWNKAIAPSPELRKAFHSELIDFNHFAQQYRAELAQQPEEGKRLADIARQQPLTLLYAAKMLVRIMPLSWRSGYERCNCRTAARPGCLSGDSGIKCSVRTQAKPC